METEGLKDRCQIDALYLYLPRKGQLTRCETENRGNSQSYQFFSNSLGGRGGSRDDPYANALLSENGGHLFQILDFGSSEGLSDFARICVEDCGYVEAFWGKPLAFQEGRPQVASPTRATFHS